MAVKASAQITLTYVVDVKAYYRYYLLQSSTLSTPSKPTTYPPASTWDDTEPLYVDGSTNTLYFVDCTVFNDNTFKYSEVSKSSSYEAAKSAYNKAVNAQESADNIYNKVTSKGEQLIVNGSGMMGNNTNFSKWDFDGSITNNSPGSFTKSLGTVRATLLSDEYFMLNTNNTYEFSFDAKSLLGQGTMYSFLTFYDVDKKNIESKHTMYHPGSTTTLAQDLTAGDTVIYLTDTSGWSTTKANFYFFSIWNYTNNFGYTYPAETYTRNVLTLSKTSNSCLDSSCINYTANTITLTTAYSGATIPAGTPVSQGGIGNSYMYFPIANKVIPSTWTRYSGMLRGVDYSGSYTSGMFPPGVAYSKVGFLWNYNSTSGEQQWITNISVTDITAANNAQNAADSAQNDIDNTKTYTHTVLSVDSGSTLAYFDFSGHVEVGTLINGADTDSTSYVRSSEYAKVNGGSTYIWEITDSSGTALTPVTHFYTYDSDSEAYVFLSSQSSTTITAPSSTDDVYLRFTVALSSDEISNTLYELTLNNLDSIVESQTINVYIGTYTTLVLYMSLDATDYVWELTDTSALKNATELAEKLNEQLNDETNGVINKLYTGIDEAKDAAKEAKDAVDDRQKYVQIDPDYPSITLVTSGDVDDPGTKLRLDSNKISFYRGTTEGAYIGYVDSEQSDRTSMAVSKTYVTEMYPRVEDPTAQNTWIGQLCWVARTNGHLSLKVVK